MSTNEHIAAATAEIRSCAAEVIGGMRNDLGIPQLAAAWRREFDSLPEKIAERVVAGLLRNGFHIRHLRPAGAVDVQAAVEGSFDQAPFRKTVTVTLALGEIGMWHSIAFEPFPKFPLDYVAGEFAGKMGALLSEQAGPVVAAALSELGTDVFGADDGAGR